MFYTPVPVQVSSSRPSTAAGAATRFSIAVKDFLTNSCRETPPEPQTEAAAAPSVGYDPKKGRDPWKESRTWPEGFVPASSS